jgi:predicted nuclease of predicted toxin-antitoxin system
MSLRLLVDANLAPRLAAVIREHGYEARHVTEVGLGPASDQAIFEWARDERWVVLTADLDFAHLAAIAKPAPAGVILLRLRSLRVERVVERLLAALPTIGDAVSQGSVAVIEETRTRLRQPW